MFAERWFIALVIAAALAALAYRLRAVSISGVVAGCLLAAVMGLSVTSAPLVVFFVFVAIGSASSRFGRAKKTALGVMQSDGGRRTALHAIANCGPAALIVLFGRFGIGLGRAEADLFAVTALAAMLADTSASEWGTWLGGSPRSILTGRRVPPGTDGGVTLAGTIAALIASCIAAVCAAVAGDYRGVHLAVIVFGAFMGNVIDSVLGATIEPRLGRHGGAIVNAAASVLGACVGAGFWWFAAGKK